MFNCGFPRGATVSGALYHTQEKGMNRINTLLLLLTSHPFTTTMASNPPGECCTSCNIHEGTPFGKYETVHGLDTYVVGDSSSRLIVILTDIFGYKLNNTLLLADQFSKAGYKVLIPDILKNDPFDSGKEDLQSWFPRHVPDITKPIVDGFLKALREEVGKNVFIGAVGYCFGAKYAVQHIAEDGVVDVAAIAHPSFVSIEEVAAIKKPIIISAAQTDQIFTTELRHETEAKLVEIGARFQIDLFSGVEHGFAVRGDILNPAVKYSKEKTLADQIKFFSLF